jgi:disulfide bond formation protein DsbB
MSVQTVETFYAILAIVAFAIVAITVVARLFASVSASARDLLGAWTGALAPNALVIAAVVATLATVGSLYFSDVAKFEPCRLCWFQRIAMYPLALVLWIAVVRRDRGVVPYVLAPAVVGALISGYHLALEWIPALDTGACGTGPACTVVWFRTFGFISLPALALAAFLLIITLLTLPVVRDRGEAAPTA